MPTAASYASILPGSIFAWRWSARMQAINVGHQRGCAGPATAVAPAHLGRPCRGCTATPPAHQQAGDEGDVHLDAPAVGAVAEPMPTAQHPVDPAKTKRHRPPGPIRYGPQLRFQGEPRRDQHHDLREPLGVRLVRGHQPHPARRRQPWGGAVPNRRRGQRRAPLRLGRPRSRGALRRSHRRHAPAPGQCNSTGGQAGSATRHRRPRPTQRCRPPRGIGMKLSIDNHRSRS